MRRSGLLKLFLVAALFSALVIAAPGYGQGQGQARGVVDVWARSAAGSWFGIARPCPDASSPVCEAACGAYGCPQLCTPGTPGCLPDEVVMTPTLHDDHTVIANDALQLARYHTPAHGAWEWKSLVTKGDFAGKLKLEATFIWFQSATTDPNDFGTCCFIGSVRPRFVAWFDRRNPDLIEGYMQPYFFPYINPATGHANVTEGDVTVPDVLAPLPEKCTPDVGCFATFRFTLRRIKVGP